jgi:hypothetical protein
MKNVVWNLDYIFLVFGSFEIKRVWKLKKLISNAYSKMW